MTVCLLLLLLIPDGYAMAQFRDPKLLYLISPRHLELRCPCGGEGLQRFYRKLDSLLIFRDSIQIHILHIGGSHVQADIWTGTLRDSFRALTPEASPPRGLVFPHRLAKTNGSASVRVLKYTGTWKRVCRSTRNRPDDSCILGLPGYAVLTTDTDASFLLASWGYPTKRVRIFFWNDSLSMIPVLRIHDSVKVEGFLCESTFPHCLEYDLPAQVETLEIRLLPPGSPSLNPQTSRFLLLGIQLINDEPGIVVHNIGVNGADVPSYLNIELLEEFMKFLQPDLIIFSIGINDTRRQNFSPEMYFLHYDSLIQRISRTLGYKPALVFTTNNDSYLSRRQWNAHSLEARKVMIRLACKYHGAYWDLFRLMGGPYSSLRWIDAGYMKRDRVHFTRKGYQLLGILLFHALIHHAGVERPVGTLRRVD